ncbi:type II toxin-antitoxin system RelE/ParE family toxin [Patescibacteria group bacterium]|nr:type II toxin-antitoxin system RelE/ParE family toxin [Patescibacteria group bacterium]
MPHQVFLFENSRGQKPVKDFIKKLDYSSKAKITRIIGLLEQYGCFLRMPYSKKLDNNIFELRIRGKNEIRVLYSSIKNKFILLHVFKKKTQKTPVKEILIAKQRLTQI